VICMTDPKEIAVLPCGHFCLCASCYRSLLTPNSKCPICRVRIAAFLRLPIESSEPKKEVIEVQEVGEKLKVQRAPRPSKEDIEAKV